MIKIRKIRIKTVIIVLLAISLMLIFTACWDQRELEDMGVVLATGIDLAPEGQTKLIVQTITPSAMSGMSGSSGGGSATEKFSNYSYQGETVFQAIRELSRIVPRQLFFAHNQIILVSEKYAYEKGVGEVLDFFMRNPQIRGTTWLLIARGELSEIMNDPGQLEDIPALRIVGIIEDRHLNSKFAIQNIAGFTETIHSSKTGSYSAILESIPNKALPDQTDESPGDGSKPKSNLTINGTALFNKGKMIGKLNTTESRGLLWILGEVNGGAIEIKNPENKENALSLEILRSKSRIRPEINDGNIQIFVKIQAISNISESAIGFDLSNEKTIKEVELLQNQAIEKEVQAALDKTQNEYRLDIFDFGGAIHRRFPKVWKSIEKDWEEIFPGIQVDIEVQSIIRRTGLITKPLESQ